MNFDDVVSVAIYPAIGIARVGNSPNEYFLGAMIPGQSAKDDSNFRDKKGRIKRQAAKFFVYGLDKDGKVLGEINLEQQGVNIDWQVEVANKKAAWYYFDLALDIPAAKGEYDENGKKVTGVPQPILCPQRNSEYVGDARSKLMIEPQAQNISGKNINEKGKNYQFKDGRIDGKKVDLGQLRTDDKGRLIFLGGKGKSKSFNKSPLTTFANNNGWYDDTSDGPVDAKVSIPTSDGNTRTLNAIGAWVVTAPPNYAVGVDASTTGYDLLRNVAAQVCPNSVPKRPEFYRDIYPIFEHQTVNQWVNAGILRDYGWGSGYDFDAAEIIAKAADPTDASRPFRESIFSACRNPNYKVMQTQAWPPLYGDAMSTSSDCEDPRAWLAVTELQYQHLQQWAKGDFDVNSPPKVLNWDSMTAQQQADGLTEAALAETLGGPFHPGCEFTWPMRNAMMYQTDMPFRIKRRTDAKEDYGMAINSALALSEGGPLDGSSAGDITKWMAVPWQSDTSSCLSGYNSFSGEYLPTFWPARVPNDVLTEDDYRVLQTGRASNDAKVQAFGVGNRKKWLRGFIYTDDGQFIYGSSISERIKGVEQFVKHWDEAGIILKKPLDANKALFPEYVWVETGRTMKDKKTKAHKDQAAFVKENPRKYR